VTATDEEPMDENDHDLFAFSREDTAEQPRAGESLPVALADPPSHSPDWRPGEQPLGQPRSSGEGAWNFGKPSITSGLPTGRRPIALALVVVLVAAVGGYLFLNRRLSSGGTAFALALSRDTNYTYDVHIRMKGTISAQGDQLPFNMQMDQTVSWKVESTDSEGTATVAVTMQTHSAQFIGQPAPAIPTQTTRIRVAKDGRILSAGFEISGLGSNSDLGSLVPGSDQFMPLLPDHPVEVGDTWTKSFDQDLPFGMGRLRYDVESSLLRYEMVDGKRFAVLFSRLSLPMDMSIDLRKVLTVSGNSMGQLLPGGSNPKMKVGGSMSMQQTAWFDQARGELDRTSADANFDMTIDFEDFPQQSNPPTGTIHFTGTMNLQVQRLPSAPKLSAKQLKALRASQNRKAQSDLRNALVATKVHFTNASTYGGFTPVVAGRLEPSLAFNGAAKARVGQVSIRVATKSAILLVTRSATGKVFCIAERIGKKIAYGTRDARTPAGCTGGW
jgi:hypothetical protein